MYLLCEDSNTPPPKKKKERYIYIYIAFNIDAHYRQCWFDCNVISAHSS